MATWQEVHFNDGKAVGKHEKQPGVFGCPFCLRRQSVLFAKNDPFVQAVIDIEVAADEYNAAAFRNSDPSLHTGPWTDRSIRAFQEMEAAKAQLQRATKALAEEALAVYGDETGKVTDPEVWVPILRVVA